MESYSPTLVSKRYNLWLTIFIKEILVPWLPGFFSLIDMDHITSGEKNIEIKKKTHVEP